jgi:hypothetical protein
MSVTVREVSSKKELKKFVHFHRDLYKKCPQWVPSLDFDEMNTLDRKVNPAFDSCRAKYWLAYDGNRVVGRIAGIINEKYIEVWKNKYARFGWVDFIDDSEVSGLLFSTVENWAKENGMDGIQGPLGFTDFDKEGMLVEGFNEIGTLTGIYNYPYYPAHLEKLNYKKEIDWLEFQIKIAPNEKMDRLAGIVEKRLKLKVLKLKKAKDIIPLARDIFKLLNDCYRDIFGFVPLSDKQVDYYTKQYFSFIHPDFIQIILDKDDKLAGFGLTMPSLSKALQKTGGKLFPFGFLHLLKAIKKNDKADLMLIAIREDLQGKGVNAIINREGYQAYKKNNITTVEACPQLETNQKVLTNWEHYDFRQHKRRRCFVKLFNPAIRA